MSKIITAFGRTEEPQAIGDSGPEVLDGAPPRPAQQQFQFRKPEFDRIQVRAVRRQVPEVRAARLDPLADAVDMVCAQVVHHQDVAWPQGGDEHLLEVCEERVAVHGAIKKTGRRQPVHAERRDEGAGLPVLMGGVVVHAIPAPTATVATNEIGGNPAFIKKYEAFGRQVCGDRPPCVTRGDDVGALLFGRADRFF